jgi:DUF917 family protein
MGAIGPTKGHQQGQSSPAGTEDRQMIIQTRSNQIEVTIMSVDRELDRVIGFKRNLQRATCVQRNGFQPFAVSFRNGEPVVVDGMGRPHPKLVLAAASAAFRNVA